MTTQTFARKLTAILSADVAGYSRLMQDDEAATVKTLEAYKQIISDLVKQHRGRVVDSPGDNLLAEFASVVDAVQCAVATQKELQARNTELPESRKMQFRIGVNLGDVIEEDLRKVAFPLPDKTSIAVLPFQNMTGLSQTPDIYVTARTSSFAYKGKSMTAPQKDEAYKKRIFNAYRSAGLK